MDVIRGFHNIRPRQRGCVATIGNFDGVHLGHQAVLGDLVEQARNMGLLSTVVIFEPQPAEYFSPGTDHPRLSDLREKTRVIALCGIDQLLCLRFDRQLATRDAEEFARELAERLDLKHLVVGHDFRFGKNRQGDVHLLERSGARFGFSLKVVKPHLSAGDRISSTAIRQKLAQGDLDGAQALLGRPYSLAGLVLHGDKLGRTIGFPTINIRPKHQTSCPQGVYAVAVHGYGDRVLEGVANLGTRPTVQGKRLQLEVHLLDFAADLYRRHLRVDLLRLIREERKFDSLEQLREQIGRDEQAARNFFRTRKRPNS